MKFIKAKKLLNQNNEFKLRRKQSLCIKLGKGSLLDNLYVISMPEERLDKRDYVTILDRDLILLTDNTDSSRRVMMAFNEEKAFEKALANKLIPGKKTKQECSVHIIFVNLDRQLEAIRGIELDGKVVLFNSLD